MASVAESVTIFLLMFLVLTLNIIVLIIFCHTNRNMKKFVNFYFFLCQTMCDMLLGTLVMPFAFAAAVSDSSMVFGQAMCDITAFLLIILLLILLFMMLALSADHYVAIRWPNRYPAVFSATRSICWTVVLCLSASLICIPSFVSGVRSKLSAQVFVCTVSWADEKSYFAAVGVILCTPLLVGLIYTTSYALTESYRKAILPMVMPERGSAMRSDRPTNYRMHCLYCVIFFLAWLPWLLLLVVDGAMGFPASTPNAAYFVTFWLGMGNGVWKFFIYLLGCPDFRLGLKIILLRMHLLKFCVCGSANQISYEST